MLRKALALTLLALALQACGGPEDPQALEEPAQDSQDSTDPIQPTACGKVTWKNYASGFFKTHCAACHAQTFSTLAKVKKSSAKAQLSSGSMPQGTKLDPATKKKILAWFTCGSP
jgi:cytochrome c5